MCVVKPGTVHTLSAHDRMVLDLEGGQPTEARRHALCEQIDLPAERYRAVLEGLADTEAAHAYAPAVVQRVRRARDERYRFERRNRRWAVLGI